MSLLTDTTAHEIDDAYIGRKVHQLLWDRQMTQTELGNILGMDQSTIAKRLRGKIGWPAATLVKTARALDTTVAYLVGETDRISPDRGPSAVTGSYQPRKSQNAGARVTRLVPTMRDTRLNEEAA